MKTAAPFIVSLLVSLSASDVAFSGQKNVFDGLIEREDRIADVQALCQGLKKNYAGWKLKKKVLRGEGYLLRSGGDTSLKPVADGDQICDHFEKLEGKISDPDVSALPKDKRSFAIAKSNLEYSDRLTGLIAAFKDTHLMLKRKVTRAFIDYGFKLKEIGGRFYISSISPQRNAAWIEAKGAAAPKIGDEVLTWDGESVEKAIHPLLKYIGESTERALHESATEFLSFRNFAYPESAELKITYRPQNGEKIEEGSARLYFDEYSNGRQKARVPDDLAYLEGIGAIDLKEVTLRRGQNASPKVLIKESTVNSERNELAGNLEGVVRYCNSYDQTLAVTGYLKSDSSVRYVKIFGFLDSDWKVSSKGSGACGTGSAVDSKEESLKLHLRNFLSEPSSSDRNQKIILDLRHNGGGSPQNARDLVALLLRAGGTARDIQTYLAVTHGNMNGAADKIFPELGYDLSSEFDKIEELEKWQSQFHAEREHSANSSEQERIFMSPALPEKLIESEGLFRSKPNLLVWTGPRCISACEKAVMILSDNKIAKIMGDRTAGTGMGMRMTDESDVEITTPSNTHIISQYPNKYFGRPTSEIGCENASLNTHSASEVLNCRIRSISENRPLPPHYQYEETLVDLLHNGKGWIEESIKVLSKGGKRG